MTYHRLLAGVDPNKDQSYFLCQLSQEMLARSLFPIGGIVKPEVRRIADEQKLATAKRKDSQGICFVGKVDLPVFLQQKLEHKAGDTIEIPADWHGYVDTPESAGFAAMAAPWQYSPEDGEKVAGHNGAHYSTIGQRKGVGVSGKPRPVFVIATDVGRNLIHVGQGAHQPGLSRKALPLRPA